MYATPSHPRASFFRRQFGRIRFFLLISLICSSRSLVLAAVNTKTIDVYLGQSVIDTPTGGIDVTPSSANAAVCRAEQSAQKFATFTGVALGTTTVTVIAKNALDATLYTVHVKRDPRQYARLQSAIATLFPASHVTIVLNDDSDKVILSGDVPNEAMSKQIMAFLESSQLTRSQLICQLAVPCACWSPCVATYCRRR